MLKILAIGFPFIAALLIIKLFPYSLNDFFTLDEQENLRQKLRPVTKREQTLQSLSILAGFLIFGIPLAFVQHQLVLHASEGRPDILFRSELWSQWEYNALPAIFLSLLIAGGLSMRYTLIRHGPERLRDELLTVVNGIPSYFNVRYYRAMSFGVGVFFVILNILASGTFIRVGEEQISFSEFFTMRTYFQDHASLKCIVRYSRRLTPLGKDVPNPYLVLNYPDGTNVDTFYLMEHSQHKAFLDAVRTAAGSDIPIYKIATTREASSASSCDDFREVENQASAEDYLLSRLREGYDNMLSGEYENAIDTFLRLVDDFPDSKLPPRYLGNIYVKSEDYESAIYYLKRALELGDSESTTHSQLAWAYLQQGNHDDALRQYTKAIAIKPNGSDYFNRAGLYWKNGNKKKSISDLEKSCSMGNQKGCRLLEKLSR